MSETTAEITTNCRKTNKEDGGTRRQDRQEAQSPPEPNGLRERTNQNAGRELTLLLPEMRLSLLARGHLLRVLGLRLGFLRAASHCLAANCFFLLPRLKLIPENFPHFLSKFTEISAGRAENLSSSAPFCLSCLGETTKERAREGGCCQVAPPPLGLTSFSLGARL
jgi:hypothetical protein